MFETIALMVIFILGVFGGVLISSIYIIEKLTNDEEAEDDDIAG